MRTIRKWQIAAAACFLVILFGGLIQTKVHAIERLEAKRSILDRHEKEISELRGAVRDLEREATLLRRVVARLAANQKRTTSVVKKSASRKMSRSKEGGNVGAF